MTTTKSKGELLRQVLLRRQLHDTGYTEDVFWIQNAMAKVGKRVRDEDGVVWRVQEIYNTKTFHDVDILRDTWKQFFDALDGH